MLIINIRFGQLLSCADKRIVIMKVFVERNSMSVKLIRFRKKISTLFTFTFAKSPTFATAVVFTHGKYFATASERSG